MILFVLFISLLLFLLLVSKNELFTNKKKKIIFLYSDLLNGQLYEDDIFPLKKKKFYNKELYVPNNTEKLLQYYSKKGDAMKYATRKYGSKANVPFLLNKNDYKPANHNTKNYK